MPHRPLVLMSFSASFQIIANSVSLLILSSALPVFSRTIGNGRFANTSVQLYPIYKLINGSNTEFIRVPSSSLLLNWFYIIVVMFVSWTTVLFFDSPWFCYLLQLYFHTSSYKSRTCSFDDHHKGALIQHDRPMSEAWFFSPFIHKLNYLLLYLVRHHSLRSPGGLWAVQLAW